MATTNLSELLFINIDDHVLIDGKWHIVGQFVCQDEDFFFLSREGKIFHATEIEKVRSKTEVWIH